MRRLGISLYPEHSTPEKDRAYMELAADYGFTRIFTCLLSVTSTPEETIREFGAFMQSAHELGFIVSVDTNQQVFKRLGATPMDIGPFAQMDVDIIRLDGGLGDMGDIMVTRNAQQIPIEFNASSNQALDTLIERGADPRNMTTCHNFYPEPYTGLSEETFMRYSRRYKGMGLSVAAFVSSREPGTFGPWPVSAGLPTCEDDRRRPIDLQVRHMIASGAVDDILIGNCFASKEELAAMAGVDTTKVTMRIELDGAISPAEREVVFDFPHFTRGDASAYMLRSSMPRFSFAERSIPARAVDAPVFKRGDVMVVNDAMAHYRGELEVALKDMENDGTRNLVGRVPAEERFLLDYVAPEHAFGFIG